MKKIYVLSFILLLMSCSKNKKKDAVANQSDTAMQTEFKAENLTEQMVYQRAVEAAIWGMPAVNFQLMYKELEGINGTYNQVVYWPKLLDWKNQTLTPNPDVIYLMPFFNTEKGPVVLEIPPADNGVFNGSVMNFWQAAIDDVGPGGLDKGKGGKYLILSPGYDMAKVPSGYIPMSSDTYRGYALLRSVLKSGSDADVKAAIDYGRRIKLYPYAQAANPPATVFLDASSGVYNSAIAYDASFYTTLNEMIQQEPWLDRDRAVIDPLNTIGIKRGESFNPDARTKEILTAAVKQAKAWLILNYENMTPFYKDTNWFFPATNETKKSVTNSFRITEVYPTDNRGVCYMIAFFSAKHIGESQFYLMSMKDKDGNLLKGNDSYRVTIPPNVPVKQYWSMTVYNRETHTFIENARWMGRSSQTPGLKKNSDGSVTLYFGAKPPAEGESNWIPTDPKRDFEVLTRFYGPTEALYNQSWKLNDIKKM